MENKIETLAELKGEKVRLRNVLESGDEKIETKKDYWKVRAKVEMLESFLLWTIVSLILILTIGGCNAIDGARQDIHQWTDTPAHHK